MAFFRKSVQTVKLADFIRQSLTYGIKDIRETIKELKDMERDMMTQSKELDNLSDEQLRVLFAGELVDQFDKLAAETNAKLAEDLGE